MRLIRSNRSASVLGLGLLLLVTGACHSVQVATATHHEPAQAVTAEPAAVATVLATPAVATALLHAPKGGAIALSGSLSIDASYVVASQAGSLVSNNGSTVLATGAGSFGQTAGNGLGFTAKNGVVALSAGNVISDGGGGIISDSGSSLLSDHGAGLIANNGGGLIANNGGGLISNNGGGLVGNNAAGVVANNTSRYGLLDTPAAPTFGQQAPAAGMKVQIVDMGTGFALPIGVDGAGKPVYAEYTNLGGSFQVYLKPGLTSSVRVVAAVPGGTDPRLQYSAIAPATVDSSGRQIDEDGAAVTRILRQVLQAKFLNLLQKRAAQGNATVPTAQDFAGFFDSGSAPPGEVQLLSSLGGGILDQLRDNPNIKPADYPAVGFLLGDVMLGASDLSVYNIDPSLYSSDEVQLVASNPYSSGNALAALKGVLQDFRKAVITLGKDKTPGQVAQLFGSKPYIQRANQFHAASQPTDPKPYYVIERPTDLVDFCSIEYFPMISGISYGCIAGTTCATRTDLDGIDFSTGYFPTNGVASLSGAEIVGLERAVATDVGAPLTDISILNVAYKSIVNGLLVQLLDPHLTEELQCVAHNYKRAVPDCVATTAASTN